MTLLQFFWPSIIITLAFLWHAHPPPLRTICYKCIPPSVLVVIPRDYISKWDQGIFKNTLFNIECKLYWFFSHIFDLFMDPACLSSWFLMPKLIIKMGAFVSVWCLVPNSCWSSIFIVNPRWPPRWSPRWPPNGPLGQYFVMGPLKLVY